MSKKRKKGKKKKHKNEAKIKETDESPLAILPMSE